MNQKFTLRFGMMLSSALFFAATAFVNAAERNQDVSAPVLLTLPNDGSIKANTDIIVHATFDASTSVRNIEIEGIQGGSTPTEVRASKMKDGKVDVDIIIRGGTVLPYLSPFVVTPSISIKVATIHYITVDNISGVFQSDANPSTDVFSRLIQVELFDEQSNEPSIILTSSSSLGTGTLSLNQSQSNQVYDKQVSEETVLFPNPVANQTLNIKLGAQISGTNTIRIFNALGALVYEERIANRDARLFTIELPVLPAGVYFARIQTSSSEIVKKFNISR